MLQKFPDLGSKSLKKLLPNIFSKNRPALLHKVLPIFWTKIGPVTYFGVLPINQNECSHLAESSTLCSVLPRSAYGSTGSSCARILSFFTVARSAFSLATVANALSSSDFISEFGSASLLDSLVRLLPASDKKGRRAKSFQ